MMDNSRLQISEFGEGSTGEDEQGSHVQGFHVFLFFYCRHLVSGYFCASFETIRNHAQMTRTRAHFTFEIVLEHIKLVLTRTKLLP
jgi:hypothetical protein